MNKECNKIRLSVVIPVYNEEAYLRQCINSVLNQTFEDYEIILVDDGSTDNSGLICDEYADKYEKIRAVHEENAGITSARHYGVEIAKGDYVTFVDADDWIESHYYADVMNEIGANDILVTGICRYFDKNRIKMERPDLAAGNYEKNDIIEKVIPFMLWEKESDGWKLDPSLCTKIFRRELILPVLRKARKVGLYYGEDTSVIYLSVLEAKRILVVGDCYYYHRQRTNGDVPVYIQDKDFFGKLYKVYDFLDKAFFESQYYDILKPQLDGFFMHSVGLKNRCKYIGKNYTEYSFDGLFPFDIIRKNSKVILYGAGILGQKYFEQNEQNGFCKIVAWIDKNKSGANIKGMSIQSLIAVKSEVFDYVLIAIDKAGVMEKIMEELMNIGVSKKKIVWHSIKRQRLLE